MILGTWFISLKIKIKSLVQNKKICDDLELEIPNWSFNSSPPAPLWARGPQRLGWGAELTHTATREW